jgi:hypothetical protein
MMMMLHCRLRAQVPFSPHRLDWMPVKSSMVLNPTDLSYAMEAAVSAQAHMRYATSCIRIMDRLLIRMCSPRTERIT